MAGKACPSSGDFYPDGTFDFDERPENGITVVRNEILASFSNGNSIVCPHCAEEITGKDRLLFNNSGEVDDFIHWIIPCPNCGKVLHKTDWTGTNQKACVAI